MVTKWFRSTMSLSPKLFRAELVWVSESFHNIPDGAVSAVRVLALEARPLRPMCALINYGGIETGAAMFTLPGTGDSMQCVFNLPQV